MTLSETMFNVGYCSGYYLFELLKYKNKNEKFEIEEFLLAYNKNMACSMEVLTKQLEEVKINKDIFLGNDLSLKLKLFKC